MPVNKHEPMPKTGVDKLHYFKLAEDSDQKLSYGNAVEVRGSVKIGFSIQSNNEIFYADNAAYTSTVTTGDLTATVEGADFPPAVLADWMGNKYENGLFTFSNAEAAYFCLAWRIKKSNGSYRYVRLYKGMFTMPSQEAQTAAGGTVHYQTQTITFSGVQTMNNGESFAILDDDDPNLPEGATKKVIEENWFKDPAWTPGMSE